VSNSLFNQADHCQYSVSCLYPPTEPDTRCLLHSTSEHKDPELFWSMITEQTRDNNFNFHGYIFPFDAHFSGWNFHQDTDFGDCRFLQNAYFSDSYFHGKVDFTGSKFSKRAEFYRTHFLNTSYDVQFGKEILFNDVTNFSESEFLGGVFFNAKFRKGSDFRDVTFKPPTVFVNTAFVGDCPFDRTDLDKVTFISCNLSGCLLRRARGLYTAVFEQNSWAEWVTWRSRRLALGDEVYVRRSELSESKIEEYRSVMRSYQDIRGNFDSKNDTAPARAFYFGEMEMRRLARENIVTQNTWVLSIYGIISGYGERWLWALSWFVVVVCLSAVLYSCNGLWVKETKPKDSEPISQTALLYRGVAWSSSGLVSSGGPGVDLGIVARDTLTHSFLVGTLIGREVYAIPANWGGQLVQIIEGVVGPILLTLMALAIRRQFKG